MKVRLNQLILIVATGLVPSLDGAQAYGYHHNHGYHGANGYHGYGHHGSHLGFHGYADGELALGLLAGALLTYAITSHHGDRNHQPPRPSAARVSPPPAKVDSSCLQEREYHTIIVIDGKEVPAWGVACLQADGSWRRNGINLGP